MSTEQVQDMRVAIRSKAQERRISELAGLAEIMRDSGFSDTALYAEITAEWTKLLKEEIK